MMKRQRYILILLCIVIIACLTLFFINRNIIFIKNGDIYSQLSKRRYKVSSDPNKEYVYVIEIDGNRAKLKMYEVTSGVAVNLFVSKNRDFIITLYASQGRDYKWNMISDTSNDTEIIRLLDINYMMTPPKKDYHVPGKKEVIVYEKPQMQNFHFKSMETGTKHIVFERITKDKSNELKLELNIAVK